MMTLSFTSIVIFFLVIGLFSIHEKKSNSQDYLLASRSLGPWAIGLSTLATGQSGFKFIGLVSYTYLTGVSSLWITVGWFIGDCLAWYSKVPELLRQKSFEESSETIPEYLAKDKGVVDKRLSTFIGLILFLFLSSYAAAQIASAGKSLQFVFHWTYESGVFLSAFFILLYCFAGGIRASVWTDVVQSLVMLLGMYALVFFSLQKSGGIQSLTEKLSLIHPSLALFFPQSFSFFTILFLSFILSGFGVLGQAHIMVRSMALDSVANMAKVRTIYLYLGYTMSLGSYLLGLAARVLYPELGSLEAEMIMPQITQDLFHPIFSGCLLAALFASAVSTADSQILVCSSAFLIRHSSKNNYLKLKLATFITILFTLFLAIKNSHVFTLVMFSWSVLASSFTALVIIKTKDQRPPSNICFWMIICGTLSSIMWRSFGLHQVMYESLPGIFFSFLPYFIWSKIKKSNKNELLSKKEKEFISTKSFITNL
ncbi:MAG: sodium:proline symporter [Zetaproteobacteria bacterium]|nr:sodium:proline symporter [Pseudobdellovibrionaceae bacterium]